MGTLIQSYGPIYGEVVNGTVQGRPNGSVYIPISNRIQLNKTTNYITNYLYNGYQRVRFCTDAGKFVQFAYSADAQDLASSVRIGLFSDEALTTLIKSYSFPAGQFNYDAINTIVPDYELDPDATYYVAGQIMNNGVPVATSQVVTCTVWVAE